MVEQWVGRASARYLDRWTPVSPRNRCSVLVAFRTRVGPSIRGDAATVEPRTYRSASSIKAHRVAACTAVEHLDAMGFHLPEQGQFVITVLRGVVSHFRHIGKGTAGFMVGACHPPLPTPLPANCAQPVTLASSFSAPPTSGRAAGFGACATPGRSTTSGSANEATA